jgi:transcriptional regulator with AAA-type ATPase domain
MEEAATTSGPILITGEAGCDHERLAHAIHAMSLRRDRPLIELATASLERARQVAIAKQASGTTLVMTIGADAPIEPAFTSMLFSPSYKVRLIAIVETEERARSTLGASYVSQMLHIQLRPLAYRAVELEFLLDRMLAERQAPHLHFADLKRENQEALRAYPWPRNLDELREIADGISAHASHGSYRRAGEVLGIAWTTLQGRFERVGLSVPLFR